MKILAIVAAGMLVASAAVPVAADAAPAPRWHGTKWRTVCTWQGRGKWRHKVCRKVRVRW